MPRAIVYGTATTEEDDAFTKIAKYVPGEVLAFFLPATALTAGRNELQWGALALGIAATPIYLAWRAKNEKPSRTLPPATYVLAIIAFVAWAMASSVPTRALIGVDDVLAQFALLATVLLIAPIDGLLAPKPAGMKGRITDPAHGYIETALTAAPSDKPAAEAALAKIRAAMEKAASAWEDKPRKIVAGLMEDESRGRVPKTPGKSTGFKPGTKVQIFVEFNPLNRGQDIAHEQLHELSQVATAAAGGGLGHHWCCYWDD